MRRDPADGRASSLMLARDDAAAKSLGFSLSRTVADEAELLLLAVAPRSQRRGIGRKLLEHFIEARDAKRRGRVHLEVRDGNPAVRHVSKPPALTPPAGGATIIAAPTAANMTR